MTIFERMRAFFLAKRRWQWVLVGVAIVAVGHYLEAKKIEPKTLAETGATLTKRLHDRLALAQPQMIADLYGRAGAGRHGIGWCGPTTAGGTLELAPTHLQRRAATAAPAPLATGRSFGAPLWRPSPTPPTEIDKAMAPLERDVGLPTPRPTIDLAELLKQERLQHPATPGIARDPFGNIIRASPKSFDAIAKEGGLNGPSPLVKPQPTTPERCRGGWMGVVDSAALTLRVTPEVGYAVWRGGGWSATILYALTLLGMAAVLVSLWNSKDMGCAVFPATLIILSAGPLLAGGVFWLMLQLLLLLTVILGKVLAGLAILLAWIAIGWKIVMFVVESLNSGDEARENLESLRATLGQTPPPGD